MNAEPAMPFPAIRIVLVCTSHPGNIGATARAMKNMGLGRLYLVAPKDYPSVVALARAAGALDILDDAVVTDTLSEAIADCSLVMGTSARQRGMPVPLIAPEDCAGKALAAQGANEVALVFGREDSGLSNEELRLCHYHVQIPTNPGYSSLNVASAVMVLCYELRKQWLAAGQAGAPGHKEEGWDRPLATERETELFLEHLERVLVDIDFLDPKAPRQLMARMRRLYNRVNLDRMEVNILRGILTATEKAVQGRTSGHPDGRPK